MIPIVETELMKICKNYSFCIYSSIYTEIKTLLMNKYELTETDRQFIYSLNDPYFVSVMVDYSYESYKGFIILLILLRGSTQLSDNPRRV